MKKSTKGAVAAGAAAVLLMGGAGSLAYWTADSTITGGSLSTGTMSLGSPTCGSWILDGSEVTANAALTKLVPGDTISRSCDIVFTGTGEHLRATVSSNAADVVKGITNMTFDTPSTTVKIGTADITELTEADTGKTITVKTSLTLKYGASDAGVPDNGNETKDKSATLNDIKLTLKQVHN